MTIYTLTSSAVHVHPPSKQHTFQSEIIMTWVYPMGHTRTIGLVYRHIFFPENSESYSSMLRVWSPSPNYRSQYRTVLKEAMKQTLEMVQICLSCR